MKCIVCEQRPARVNGLCQNCHTKIEAETTRQNGKTSKPTYYLTYRGHVVGLYPQADGKLHARLELRKTGARLPKKITIDLNGYCEGYDRETIKRFKACVLQVAHAWR